MTSSAARLCLSLVLVALAWHSTFVHMWGRWFPAWSQTHLSLVDRLMVGETQYRHGPLVLLVSAALAFRAWRRHRRDDETVELRRPDPADRALGHALLIAALAVHLFSVRLGVAFTSGLALVATILALLLIVGGRAMLRRYGPPAALLVMMIPLPLLWIAQLNFTLKMFAASSAAGLVEAVTGSTVAIDGARVALMGPAGLSESLSIDAACSGLRSLIALVWFGAVLAVVCRQSPPWRWAMLGLTLPLALACNVIRIAVLIGLAQGWGAAAVAEDGPLHALAGVASFAAALGAMLALDRALRWVGQAGASPAAQPSRRCVSPSQSPTISPPRRGRPVDFAPAAAMLIVAATGSLGMGGPAVAVAAAAAAEAAAVRVTWRPPATLPIEGAAWPGRDLPIDDALRATLGTDDILHRRYLDPRSTGGVDLVVVRQSADRRAIHPPIVCLEALGHEVLDQRDRAVALSAPRVRPGAATDPTVTLRQLTTRHGDDVYVHLFIYRLGPADFTTSYVQQQLASAFAGRRASLIRITARAHRPTDTADLAARAAGMLLATLE